MTGNNAQRQRPVPRPLTYAESIGICEKLLPFCDRQLEIAEELEENGFKAFRPQLDFEYSFCESEEERSFFKKCQSERAKENVLAAARSSPGREPTSEDVYVDYVEPRSAFLTKLRQKRDLENGCLPQDLFQNYNFEEAKWRLEYDPILRRIAQLEQTVRDEFVERILEDEWRICDEEARTHKIDMVNRGGRTRAKLCRVFLDSASHHLGGIGFEVVKHKSPRHFPTVTKPLNDLWDLRFGPRHTKDWKFKPLVPREWRPAHEFADLHLILCHSTLHEQVIDVPAVSVNKLHIRFQWVLPQFARPYNRFFGPDDLELIVMAYAAMLKLILPEFETSLKSDEFLN